MWAWLVLLVLLQIVAEEVNVRAQLLALPAYRARRSSQTDPLDVIAEISCS